MPEKVDELANECRFGGKNQIPNRAIAAGPAQLNRRDPVEHMNQIMRCLNSGGELVLETLIIESEDCESLHPDGRYSKMNNVWFIPSCSLLLKWAEDAGFKNARIIDVTKTTIEEQRKTDWMAFESLNDFLDKGDTNKTIEGLPAPCRAILLAEKP